MAGKYLEDRSLARSGLSQSRRCICKGRRSRQGAQGLFHVPGIAAARQWCGAGAYAAAIVVTEVATRHGVQMPDSAIVATVGDSKVPANMWLGTAGRAV
nr:MULTISPECIES: hypothetical protein [Xanthomonas]